MPECVHIQTSRLILRTVAMADVEQVAASWDLYKGPVSLEEAERRIHWMAANHAQNSPGRLVHLCLAVTDKASGEIIGWCGLEHRDREQETPVLFYLLKESCWGQGLATEAARALLRLAFTDLALPRIDSGAAFDNIASKRVMEKLGMVYLGLDHEGGHSFTITREEFLQI